MLKYTNQFADYMQTQVVARGAATPQALYEPIDYLLSLSGKRVRPMLALIACDLVSGDCTAALHAADAIELFHNFTLMHDDIMDKSAVRRGQPTVHERYNMNTAILSGDAMLVLAYKALLAKADTPNMMAILQTFTRVAIEVCEGQQMDMNFEECDTVSEADYINMIRLKTAVLLGAALKIGAYCGGATEQEADILYQFGENIGIAFQLQDDILDTFGDQATFGKRIGGDILNNKKTFLWLKANEAASDSERAYFAQWAATSPSSLVAENEKINAITELFDLTGARAAAESAMQTYYQKGLAGLATLTANNKNLSADALQNLYDIASGLMLRKV